MTTNYTTIYNGGGGGGGGGGAAQILAHGSKVTERGQDVSWCLQIECVNIDVGSSFSQRTGYMKQINIATRGIPSRLVLTANCYCYRPDDSDIGGNRFKFIVDVLLVPRSFNMKTCSDLYYSSSPYYEEPAEWRIEKRRLPGSIILLRRFAVHGQFTVPVEFVVTTRNGILIAVPSELSPTTASATTTANANPTATDPTSIVVIAHNMFAQPPHRTWRLSRAIPRAPAGSSLAHQCSQIEMPVTTGTTTPRLLSAFMKNTDMEVRLFNVAAPIALALRRTHLLRIDEDQLAATTQTKKPKDYFPKHMRLPSVSRRRAGAVAAHASVFGMSGKLGCA
ncbi:hypothetical protein BC827DRAFT_1155370 [Russula dissimulans]|nr:hypothetical protein BC827DRAFT_1155370 [Russula dissimulans]